MSGRQGSPAGARGEEAKIIAVLHDVIEDTPVTAEDLRQAGFSEAVVAAVLCMTHCQFEVILIHDRVR